MQQEGLLPDVITFAGNGEPTLHPQFANIIHDTLALRQEYCPQARVAVLTNASTLGSDTVRQALMLVDDNILKLDSGLASTIVAIDRPNTAFDLEKLVSQLKSFNGQLIIQTLFLQGMVDGVPINNTTEEDISAWLSILKEVKPRSVMIYTISRDTPFQTLQKVSLPHLNSIADKARQAGFNVQVSG
jgi:wyosine [tRNA(Phe)-imidazoG37] synthetase (radical SAM superfamily)